MKRIIAIGLVGLMSTAAVYSSVEEPEAEDIRVEYAGVTLTPDILVRFNIVHPYFRQQLKVSAEKLMSPQSKAVHALALEYRFSLSSTGEFHRNSSGPGDWNSTTEDGVDGGYIPLEAIREQALRGIDRACIENKESLTEAEATACRRFYESYKTYMAIAQSKSDEQK